MLTPEFTYSPKQLKYWHETTTKYNLMPKGRRCGFTHSAAIAAIDWSLDADLETLWVDTVQKNIDAYFEKYFKPILKQLPNSMWKWGAQSKILNILNSTIRFGSAERPENLEGFSYDKMIINEAGIILKGDRGRRLWNDSLKLMTVDRKCDVFIGGTPKGKKNKDGTDTQYFEMYNTALSRPDRYTITHMTALDNPFIQRCEILEELKDTVEGPHRDQEFYGRFVEYQSGIVKRHWIHIDEVPVDGKLVRCWDLAFTKGGGDYSSGGLGSITPRVQIQDVVRCREEWPVLRALIIQTAKADGREVPIYVESNGTQKGYYQDLLSCQELKGYTVKPFDPKKYGDKLSRANPWICRLEPQELTILRGAYTGEWINEVCAFTGDDSHAEDAQVDVTSMIWHIATGKNKNFGVFVL